MNDVLNGAIDFAFTQSSWFEANHPDKMPLFRFHDTAPAAYQGEDYPFLTTTDLVPTFGVAAAPGVPRALRTQVFDALSRLNASHPAARAAGIATFTLPASYEKCRVLAERLGILYRTPDGGKACLDQFADLPRLITCPPGWTEDDPAGMLAGCARAGLPCPAGLRCLCGPCRPAAAANMFQWPVVLGLCLALVGVGLGLAVASRASLASFEFLGALLHAMCGACCSRRGRPRRRGGQPP